MSSDIKLITKDTILPKLWLYDWDVVINGVPHYVVKIPGYVHTIGGRYGYNDLWAYPRSEQPTYDSLIEFDSDQATCWGIQYKPVNFYATKWGETSSRTLGRIDITRNGEVFYTLYGNMAYGLARAQSLIYDFAEHPLELDMIDYDKKVIGRKVWWRSEPAIVTGFIKGQACVILAPDGIEHFTVPAEFASEDPNYYEDNTVKTFIMDKHIWWFRED